jgi:peptidoglycan/LPS O-acetylase OafA/YrhL
VFFCLSGFLICKSLQKPVDLADFISARVLRIFPNLAFALVVVSATTMVWYHNYSNVTSHAKYVFKNLLMFSHGVSFTIPNVFSDSLWPTINGALWSLPCELWLYVFLFLIVATGSRLLIVACAIALTIAYASPLIDISLGPFTSSQFYRLGSFFLSGAVLAIYWPLIQNRAVEFGAVSLIVVVAIHQISPTFVAINPLGVAAITIGLGSSKLMAWFARGGDASYGIYIFAWPVQQFSQLLIGSFWLSMLAAGLVTSAIGYLTWHSFERRTMEHRAAVAQWIRDIMTRPLPAYSKITVGTNRAQNRNKIVQLDLDVGHTP